MKINLSTGDEIPRERLLERLVENLYTRNDLVLSRGNFRVRGEIIDIFPAYMESAIRVELWGDEIDGIYELNALTGEVGQPIQQFDLYPANQFITQRHKLEKAIHEIRDELDGRVTHLRITTFSLKPSVFVCALTMI